MVAFDDWTQREQYGVAGFANSQNYPNGTHIIALIIVFNVLVAILCRPQGYITRLLYARRRKTTLIDEQNF